MKGILFKYDADPNGLCLKDKSDQKLCAGFIDPDFWTNPFPVWSICGPYVRQSLDKGDFVFFLPKKWSYLRAGYSDFICAGILKVDDKISNCYDFLALNWVSNIYQTNYVWDLAKHLVRDANKAPKTQIIRPRNIIVGGWDQSIWFGRNNLDLNNVLSLLNIQINIRGRKIRKLTTSETKQLYNYYISNILQNSPQCLYTGFHYRLPNLI